MTPDFALELTTEMLWTAILVCAPVLGLSMLVGLLISMFQVVTQIQEMSLTFIPKILTVALAIIAFGAWMLNNIVQFAHSTIENIPFYYK
ncbi:MAG: flagellar biosynthesis protein FliQ [Gammaproteobacteria bacterium]|nr:flagellar biosynthesis protein FliQ [Gammaproteobacteria bacterium]